VALTHAVQAARFTKLSELNLVLLCYFAIYVLLRRSSSHPPLMSNMLPSVLGVGLLGVGLTNLALLTKDNTIRIHFCAFLAGIGLLLFGFGWRGSIAYWRPLAILLSMSVPRLLIQKLLDIAPATAEVAGLLLWYVGLDVKVDGITVALPMGSVRVDVGCVGAGGLTFVFCVAVLFLMLFPVRRAQSVVILLIAVGAGFLSNTLRVATLALIDAYGSSAAFGFWHQGGGSTIWTLLPVTLLGAYCLKCTKKRPSD
jgi:cyanoexosortase A